MTHPEIHNRLIEQGNYAIMDFTKWNMGHSIERVNAGFERIAIQTFADINPL